MTTPETISHDRAIELLPWLVNDSLSPFEKALVKAHVRSCIICRRDIDELESLRDSVNLAAADDAVPPLDMRRINRRIDNDLARRRRLPGLLAEVRQFLSQPLYAAVVAQSVIIVALIVMLLLPPSQQAEYTTLSDPAQLPAGEYLRVVVDPQMSGSSWTELLSRFDLSVIDGPSERGVATLAFDESTSSSARDEAVTRLSSHANIRFVQPLSVPGS